MAKIKTTKESRFGKSVLTKIGEVEFDRNGCAEVPDKYLQKLLDSDPTVESLEPKKAKADNAKAVKQADKKDEDTEDLGKEEKDSEELGDGADDLDNPEMDNIKSQLEAMNIEDIKDICLKAGMNPKSVNKSGKNSLIAKILSNSNLISSFPS